MMPLSARGWQRQEVINQMTNQKSSLPSASLEADAQYIPPKAEGKSCKIATNEIKPNRHQWKIFAHQFIKGISQK